jgi:hypothetical protein
MMRKKNRPKIQPKKGFVSLCRNLTVMKKTQEDLATIKTYPKNTKLNNQANKDDVRDYLRKNHVCTRPTERQIVHVCICQGKTHVYVLKHCQVKDKDKKINLKMKIGCQAIR